MPLNNTQLGFAFATTTPHGLTSRRAADSQAHSSKGTPSPHKEALTDCKRTVSGTISLPSRVLFTIPSRYYPLSVTKSIQAYRVVPADSQQIPRARCYSGTTSTHTHHVFTYRTLTVYGGPSQTTSANTTRACAGWQTHTTSPHNPVHATPARYHTHTV